jgi:hypothetical protein
MQSKKGLRMSMRSSISVEIQQGEGANLRNEMVRYMLEWWASNSE